jgi:hypothetical protein
MIQIPFFPRPLTPRVEEPWGKKSRASNLALHRSTSSRIASGPADGETKNPRQPRDSTADAISAPSAQRRTWSFDAKEEHMALDAAIREADAEAAAERTNPIVEILILSQGRAEGAPGRAGVGARKKRGVPRRHGKHAAWELLSPDLRCFCRTV